MISSRRRALAAGIGAAATLAGAALWRLWPEQGLLNPCLGALPPELARHPLIAEAWSGLDAAQVWDCHAHLLGIGDGGGDLGFAPDRPASS